MELEWEVMKTALLNSAAYSKSRMAFLKSFIIVYGGSHRPGLGHFPIIFNYEQKLREEQTNKYYCKMENKMWGDLWWKLFHEEEREGEERRTDPYIALPSTTTRSHSCHKFQYLLKYLREEKVVTPLLAENERWSKKYGCEVIDSYFTDRFTNT